MDKKLVANVIEALLTKAQNESDAVRAMNYAQAACNAANALRATMEAERVASEMS